MSVGVDRVLMRIAKINKSLESWAEVGEALSRSADDSQSWLGLVEVDLGTYVEVSQQEYFLMYRMPMATKGNLMASNPWLRRNRRGNILSNVNKVVHTASGTAPGTVLHDPLSRLQAH